MRICLPVLGLMAGVALIAACAPRPVLTESAFEPVPINRTAWVAPNTNSFVLDAAREAREDFRSTLAMEVREADDENQRGVIFTQYVNRASEAEYGIGGAAQRFDRGLPGTLAGAFSAEGHTREVTQAGGTVVSSRAFAGGRETTYRDRNGDTCVMVGNARLRDAAQGEAGGFDFVSHGILCGPADTRSAFVAYVRGGSIVSRTARTDGEPKEFRLPSLSIPCPIPVLCR